MTGIAVDKAGAHRVVYTSTGKVKVHIGQLHTCIN